jgi:predicted ATPase
VRCEGDGFFFAFPTADGAVEGALAAHAALGAEPWPDDAAVRVRIGMHVGAATPGPDGDYIALAVHQAARIAAAAHGGQTLASRAVVELAPGQVAARPLGAFRLKGFEGNEEVFELRRADDERPPFPAPALLPASGGNLPRPRTSFVGRRDDLTAVTKQMETSRLVTLVGPGGTGKTRLALEVARAADDRADGRWFVDLAPLASAPAVAAAVADRLGLRDVGGDVEDAVVDALAGRDALLVVDNAEHVVAGVAALADRLLDAAADVTLIVTSREPLHVPGEAVVPIPPMEVPPEHDLVGGVEALLDVDAVRLFVDRAMAADPTFRFDDRTAADIAAVCRAVDGLPLAVELAAARVRTLSPGQLAERLRARFTVLGSHPRPASERQANLEALVDWSHELLEEDERVAFRRLAVFAGGFTVEAAERVVGRPPLRRADVVDLLSSLVDRSLVRLEPDPAVRRFRLLETIRAFAAARLAESGEATSTAAAHAAWAVELAEQAAPHLLAADQPAWLALLDREWPNVRAALDHAELSDPETAARLAVALGRYWLDRGAPEEGRQRVARAAAVASDPATCSRLHSIGARLALVQGDYTSAGLLAAEAEAEARRAGDDGALALALQAGAERALREGRPVEAAAGFAASLPLAQAHCPPSIAVVGMLGLAAAQRDLGDVDGGRPGFEAALALARTVGDPPTLASALGYAGDAQLSAGDVDGAEARFEEELAVGRAAGHPYLIALALTDLANLAMAADDVAGARRRYEEALDVARSIGDRQRMARCLDGLGMASMAEGDAAGAREQLEESRRLSRAIGYAGGIVNAEVGLARLRFADGDLAGAHPHLLAALEAMTAGGSVRTAATLLEGLAQLHLAAGHPERAARLLSAAATIGGSDQGAEEFRPALVEALGADGFEAAWAAGASLTPAEATALAGEAP